MEGLQNETKVAREGLKHRIEQSKKTFVKTRSYSTAKKLLKDQRRVTLTGMLGEGKTSIALMLCSEYQEEGYNVVFVRDHENFDINNHIQEGCKLLFVFDDVFKSGRIPVCKQKVDQLLNDIQDYLQSFLIRPKSASLIDPKVNISVIFTCKTYDFREGCSPLCQFSTTLFKKETILDLTKMSLTEEEKYEMIEKMEIEFVDEVILKLLVSLNIGIFGFPLTLKLYCMHTQEGTNPVEFFQNPMQYLTADLKNIIQNENNSSAFLILLFLQGGHIALNSLGEKGNAKLYAKIRELIPSFTSRKLDQEVEKFEGSYVDVDDTHASFIHPSIYNAVGCVLCEVDKDLLFSHCSAKFVFDRVKLSKEHRQKTVRVEADGIISIPFSWYEFLAKRFAQLIKDGELKYTLCHDFLHEPCFCLLLYKEIRGDMQQIVHVVDVNTDAPFLGWATFPTVTTILEDTIQCLGTKYPHNDGQEICLISTYICLLHGNCAAMKLLMEWIRTEGQYDIDKTFNGRTLLMEAAKLGQYEIFEYLLHEGANVKLKDTQGKTVLHLSCETGNTIIVSKLLTMNINIDVQDDKGRSPVMIAACNGYVDVFKALAAKGAKLTLSDKYNNKCLILAMGDPSFPLKFESCREEERLEIVKYLVENAKQDVNMHGLNGMTPIIAAVAVGQQNIQNYLISKHADITATDNDNDDCLIYACKGENLEILKDILSRKAFDVNKKGNNGLTPIMIAAGNGNENMFQLLKMKKPDFSVVDDNGCSCLIHACLGRSVSILKDILNVHGSLINKANKHGLTPLMVVAATGHHEFLHVLIEQGASLTQCDKSGNDCLMHACISGNLSIVEKLMEQSQVNVNKQYHSGLIPVIVAAKTGQTDLFSLLVDKGADVFLRDSKNDDCLLHASRGGHLSVVKKLIETGGIDVHKSGNKNMTSIMLAARKGHEKIFTLLMDQGVDLSACDIYNDNCFAHACKGGNVSIIKCLLNLPENDINRKGHLGMTPVMVVAARGNHQIFDLLLNNGASLSILDKNGKSCISHACRGENPTIVKMVVSKVPEFIDIPGLRGITPLMLMASNGNEVLFNILADGGADLSLIDEYNHNCLHHACYFSGSALIVQKILSNHFPDINLKNQYGLSPLMISCIQGNDESFKYLAEKNADITLYDNENNSCLFLACEGGNQVIVERLVKTCAVNERGVRGMTPIMFAMRMGQEQIFDILLKSGADLTLHDKDNDHCLMHACDGGSMEIMKKVFSKKLDFLNMRGHSGKTAVMQAAILGDKRMFDFLLDKGADLTLIDVNNDHCLMHACEGGNLLILETLMSKNIYSLKKRGWCGCTPLMKAAENGHNAIIDYLIEKGADVSLTDDNDEDCFMIACKGKYLKLVKYLVFKYQFDVNRKRKHGVRPVLALAELQHKEQYEFLMSKGADLSSFNIMEHNVIISMCSKNNEFIEKILFLTMADINRKGFGGRTMLMESALKGHNKLVDTLLSEGGIVSLCDDNDHDSVWYAFQGRNIVTVKQLLNATTCNCMERCNMYAKMAIALGHEDIFDFLFSMGLNVSFDCFIQACIQGHLKLVIQILTVARFDVNSIGSNGLTALMASALYGQEEVFKFLLDNGATLSPENTDESNRDCLLLASYRGTVEIVKMIIETNKFDKNVRLDHGSSPLLIAAQYGNYDVFWYLVKNSADVMLTDNDNDDCLRLACSSGNHQLVLSILELKQHDVNKKGERGWTPAMTAAKEGHVNILLSLIEMDVDLLLTDDDNSDCLMLACLANQLEVVRTLLSYKIFDINRQGQSGMTPLMAAARTGNVSMFELLLSNKADVFPLSDENGFDCLLHAAKGGNVAILDKLLSYKAFNVNATAKNGTTPVLQAAENDHWEVIFSLQRNGANLDATDMIKDNCIMKSCRSGNDGLLGQLLRIHPFDVDAETEDGWTPAMIAASEGHFSVLRILSLMGASLVKLNCDSNDCLMIACKKGKLDIVRFLLSLNIYDINRRYEHDWTPLMAAAKYGHGHLFELLLSEGALLCGYGCKMSDLFLLSLKGGNASIVKHILSTKSVKVNPESPLETSPVLLSAYRGQYDVFQMLVAEGACLKVEDENGDDCLGLACEGGSAQIVDNLLKQYRSYKRSLFDVNRSGKNGLTPLMTATMRGHLDIFILLLKAGACVTMTDKDGNNCLILACMNGKQSIVRYILKESLIPVNTRGHRYETPLLAASIQGNVGIFRLLLSWGADLNMRNEDNNGCLMLASINNKVSIVRFIVTIPGYDIDVKEQHGKTPVMVAAGSKNSALFETLWSAGAAVYLRDDNGKSCAEYACEGENYALCQKLSRIQETVIYIRDPTRRSTPRSFSTHKEPPAPLVHFLQAKNKYDPEYLNRLINQVYYNI